MLKLRCCCVTISLKGALILGAILLSAQLLLITALTLTALVHNPEDGWETLSDMFQLYGGIENFHQKQTYLNLYLISIPLLIEAVIGLFVCAHKLRHHLLVPAIIALIFNIITSVVTLTFQSQSLADFLKLEPIELGVQMEKDRDLIVGMRGGSIALNVVFLIVTLWLLLIIAQSYRYLWRKNRKYQIISVDLAVIADPAYRCCCRAVHVRTASFVIALLQIFPIVVFIWLIVFSYLQLSETRKYFNTGAENLLGQFLVASFRIVAPLSLPIYVEGMVFTLRGFRKQHQNYLVPILTALVYGICFLLFIVGTQIARIVSVASDDESVSWESQQRSLIYGGIIIAVSTLFFTASIWFFAVIISCFKYYKNNSIKTYIQH